MRQDVTVTFVEPRSADALHDVQRAAGRDGRRADAQRCRRGCASGTGTRTLAITGLAAEPG